jgi:hypothetical protein
MSESDSFLISSEVGSLIDVASTTAFIVMV